MPEFTVWGPGDCPVQSTTIGTWMNTPSRRLTLGLYLATTTPAGTYLICATCKHGDWPTHHISATANTSAYHRGHRGLLHYGYCHCPCHIGRPEALEPTNLTANGCHHWHLGKQHGDTKIGLPGPTGASIHHPEVYKQACPAHHCNHCGSKIGLAGTPVASKTVLQPPLITA